MPEKKKLGRPSIEANIAIQNETLNEQRLKYEYLEAQAMNAISQQRNEILQMQALARAKIEEQERTLAEVIKSKRQMEEYAQARFQALTDENTDKSHC